MPPVKRRKPLPAMPVRNRFCLAIAVGAPQRFVSVREAPKALDNILMVKRELQQALVAKTAYQADGFTLILKIFAMLKWQVQEKPLVLVQAGVQPLFNGEFSNAECNMIGSKGLRCAAIGIAWDLIEQENRGERNVGILGKGLDRLAA